MATLSFKFRSINEQINLEKRFLSVSAPPNLFHKLDEKRRLPLSFLIPPTISLYPSHRLPHFSFSLNNFNARFFYSSSILISFLRGQDDQWSSRTRLSWLCSSCHLEPRLARPSPPESSRMSFCLCRSNIFGLFASQSTLIKRNYSLALH
jgi:hypothetical protein